MLNKLISIFNQKEDVEEKKAAPPVVISNSLSHVLSHASTGKIIQGIESHRLALVTIRKKGPLFLLGVQYERDAGGEIFTERHDSMVETEEEARKFFANFGLGEISWIGEMA